MRQRPADTRREIWSRIEMSRMSMVPWYADKEKSHVAHRAIHDALAERDAEAARRTTHKHWKGTRDETSPWHGGPGQA